MSVRCHFYVRTQVNLGSGYRYHSIAVREPAGAGPVLLAEALAMGDLVSLRDENTQVVGSYRVIERSWLHASYGSYDWPYNAPMATTPPMLDLIVVEAEGVFRNEAEIDQDGGYVPTERY